MNTNEPNIDDLKLHLLGKTSGKEAEDLDLLILRDDGSLDQLLSTAVGELRYELASGAMSNEDRDEFIRRFPPTPESVKETRIDKYLSEAVEGVAPEAARQESETVSVGILDRIRSTLESVATPAWGYAVAAVLLVSVIGNVYWFTTRGGGHHPRVAALSAQTIDLKPAATTREAATVPQATTGVLVFRLDVGEIEHAEYLVSLAREGRDPFWSQWKLQAADIGDTAVVEVSVPSDLLEDGIYELDLSGSEGDRRTGPVVTYRFAGPRR